MNQRNSENAYLEARSRYEKYKAKFQIEWAQPIAETAMTIGWQNADPMAKTTLAQYAPAEFDKMQKKFGGKDGAA